jgi:phytoene dehydrogenase-like protein
MLSILHARLRVQRAPGFPCALCFQKANVQAKLGRYPRSETLNQLFSARPMLGHADYRGPLKGLYHCGSGAHPGGGVTGAPGHNAARVILGDHRALFG